MKKTSDLLDIEKIDLDEAIALASPTDTPFSTLLMQNGLTAGASSTTVSWREKQLNDTRRGPRLEGAEASDPLKSSRLEKKNNQQIFERTAEISGTAKAVKVPGIPGGELSSEINDRMIEAKLELEDYLINGTMADETTTAGRQMNGLINLTNPANKFAVADTGGLLTQEDLKKAMKLPWQKGLGGDKFIMVNDVVKEYLNQLFKVEKGVVIPAMQGSGNVIGLTVDQIHTDFGNANILINRWMTASTAAVFDLSQFKLRPLRTFSAEQLAKNGDSEKWMIIGEYTLQLTNSYSASIINNIKGYKEA
ncbi:SU10 major capsid protein [Listeria ilorinensis]|uniref:SU10 major capsid protein n=1 Tax=Listeria ilorinensis TaxID=2867439 RepID=UPI001EF3E9F1|nr:DUF5309 family protein [Listeria ilorinensis]